MNNDGLIRVGRGGSWLSDARFARVAYNYWYIPSNRLVFLGFRLSRIVNPLEQLSEVFDETR